MLHAVWMVEHFIGHSLGLRLHKLIQGLIRYRRLKFRKHAGLVRATSPLLLKYNYISKVVISYE